MSEGLRRRLNQYNLALLEGRNKQGCCEMTGVRWVDGGCQHPFVRFLTCSREC